MNSATERMLVSVFSGVLGIFHEFSCFKSAGFEEHLG